MDAKVSAFLHSTTFPCLVCRGISMDSRPLSQRRISLAPTLGAKPSKNSFNDCLCTSCQPLPGFAITRTEMDIHEHPQVPSAHGYIFLIPPRYHRLRMEAWTTKVWQPSGRRICTASATLRTVSSALAMSISEHQRCGRDREWAFGLHVHPLTLSLKGVRLDRRRRTVDFIAVSSSSQVTVTSQRIFNVPGRHILPKHGYVRTSLRTR